MARVAIVFFGMAALLAVPASANAAGDAKKGEAVFARCSVCHNVDKGGENMIGPNLFGVAGRKAASVPGFGYSSALKGSGITWTDDKLLAWVTGPAKLVPGTKMAFAGITNKDQQADVVAYLKSLK